MRHLARGFPAPALALFLAAALAPEARALPGPPAPLWTSAHEIPGTNGLGGSVATRMLADGSTMIALGDGTFTGVMTVRYDAAGTELSHVNVSPPHQRFVALDPFGALYVLATSSANGTEFWVMKYDGISGHPLWPAPAEVHNPGSTFHSAFAVAVDPHGDVVALGQVGSTPSFDWATFKLDGRNGATLWGPVTFDGAAHGSDTPVALALDAAGNVAVTGASSNGANDDFATMKYSGATGAVVWGPRLYNSPANATDTPIAVAFDPAGNVVVTGRSIDPPNSSYDVATWKYDGATGATLWGPAVLKPSSGGQDVVQAMAVDPRGNVVVTASAFAGSNYDWATVKYDSQTGAVAWGPVFYGASPTDVPVAIVADAHGDVFVAGRKGNPGAFDMVTLSYDGRTGAVRWGPDVFDAASEMPLVGGLLLDSSGGVVLTGTTGPPNRLVTLKYSAATGATVWGPVYRTGDAGRFTSPVAMTTSASGDVFTADWAQDASGNVITEVRRLAAQTGALVWSTLVPDRHARGIAIDAAGNPVVVFSHSGAGGWVDTQTIKYAGATGAPLWTAIFSQSGTFDDTPRVVDVDGAGDVLVSGISGAGAVAQIFTLKYAGATGAPIWGPTLSASIPNVAVAEFFQKIDSAGNLVYVTDGLQGTGPFNDSFLTAKISGSTGAVVWGPIDFIDGGFAFPSGLALDASGNVFVSGHGYDGSSAVDLVLLKYAAATGATLWGPVRYHAATAGARPLVAVDSSGNVFMSGYLSGSPFSIATLKYNGATGALLWGPSLVSNATVDAIAVNGAGDVVVAGRRDNLTPDFLLVQYAGTDGSVVWGPLITDSGQDDRDQALRLVGNDPVVYGGIDYSVTVRYSLALTITNPPGDLPSATCGVPYAGSLSAQNGNGGLTWTVVSGALPDGIFLGSSGAFSGTPTSQGTFAFRARVTDGAAAFAERDFAITVGGHGTFVAVAASPDPTCPGEPVTLSVPGTWSSYLWLRGGETTPTIQVSPLATAEYGVLLGDGTGCVTHGVGRVDVRAPVFGTAAAITSISPASGLAAGPVSLALSGSDFASGATGAVGGVAAGSVSVTSCLAAHLSTPSLPPGTLNDVAWTNPGAAASTLANAFFADFLDVPQSHLFHSFVEKLVRHAVAAGCGSGAYCVGTPVTRGQIAVFLLRSNDGPTYVPPPCTTPPFSDVPCANPFSRWIQELSARGVTAGCAPGSYCPNSPVTRGQMAVFLLRTKDGLGYTPPPCTTPPFADVPCSSGFAIWIQELVHRGITAGCGGGDYCPGDPVTRGQMAVFLATTFALS